MRMTVPSVDEVLRDGRIDGSNRRIDQELLDALTDQLPEEYLDGQRRRRWPEGTSFTGTTFIGDVKFTNAAFSGSSWFGGATFEGEARFQNAVFEDDASFFGTRFAGSAWFVDASFGGNAYFSRASFEDSTVFDAATFTDTAAFEAARFAEARFLGPFIGLSEVLLWDAVFSEAVEIAVAAPVVDANGLQLKKGGTLRVRWAAVDIANASFAEPTLLTGAEALPHARWRGGLLEEGELRARMDIDQSTDGRPRLVSLRHANTINLVLGAVDIRRSTFADARNLDQIRMLPAARLAVTPGWRGRWGERRRPAWMLTRRQLIADEYLWRLRGARQECQEQCVEILAGSAPERPPTRYSGLEAKRHERRAEAAEIAGLYRQLRKSREDSKDEPGAGDFYYGECEMRRLAPNTPGGERAVLWLYWLVSGYGLRAWRALTALAITILVFAVLLSSFGFEPRPSFVDSLLFSAASTSSLFRVPDTPGAELTNGGEFLQIVLRLLGPLFFGLALLSLRGRAKR